MKLFRFIRSSVESCRRQLAELLPPLLLPMTSKESRHETHQPFQPLCAETLAPCPAHAPQDAHRRPGGVR